MIDWPEILLAAGGTVASVCLAIWKAKKTAKSEIEKLQTIWAHEKETACDADFDAMVAAVSLYAKRPAPKDFQDATNAVAIYRAKASGDMAKEVEKLSSLILRECPNCVAVSEQLGVIIACKRNANC